MRAGRAASTKDGYTRKLAEGAQATNWQYCQDLRVLLLRFGRPMPVPPANIPVAAPHARTRQRPFRTRRDWRTPAKRRPGTGVSVPPPHLYPAKAALFAKVQVIPRNRQMLKCMWCKSRHIPLALAQKNWPNVPVHEYKQVARHSYSAFVLALTPRWRGRTGPGWSTGSRLCRRTRFSLNIGG